MDCNSHLLVVGATQNIFVPTVTGNYAAIINEQSCTDTSACFQVFTGINSIENNFQFSIYPNPASSELIVSSPLFIGSVISITDVLGREILQTTNTQTSNKINISNIPSGIYYCLLKNGKTTLAVRKFVKL